jgi:hypothetical protein
VEDGRIAFRAGINIGDVIVEAHAVIEKAARRRLQKIL